MICSFALSLIPGTKGIPQVEVRVWETVTSRLDYNPRQSI